MEIKIGLIGLGTIADRIAKGIICSDNGTLYAVASRSYEKAVAFKEKYQAKKAYGSYEELLNDKEIDLVYIATINQSHYELIKKSVDYGKHIICEKPLVKNCEQTKEVYAYALSKNIFLMEAQKACFTALTRKIIALIDNDLIGKIQTINASYCTYANHPIKHWVMDREYGGVMKDIGVYPLAYANLIANSKIKDVNVPLIEKVGETDVKVRLMIEYVNGIIANIEASFKDEIHNFAIICGTKGKIVVENFWKNDIAKLFIDNEVYDIKVVQESEFQAEIDHACMCVANNLKEAKYYSHFDSIEVARIVDIVKNS